MVELFNLKQRPEYLTEVIKLIRKNSNFLGDDYVPLNEISEIAKHVKEYEDSYFIGLKDDNLIIAFEIFSIFGGIKQNHSCELMAVAPRKVSVNDTREAFSQLMDLLYDDFKFVKLKACIEVHNKPAKKFLLDMGFKKEGYVKGHSLKNGRLKNVLQYGKLKARYLENDSRRKNRISKKSWSKPVR